jgi:hypothetical protein
MSIGFVCAVVVNFFVGKRALMVRKARAAAAVAAVTKMKKRLDAVVRLKHHMGSMMVRQKQIWTRRMRRGSRLLLWLATGVKQPAASLR